MREQLIQYVNLLFAGAPDSEEIREEILQNTLDRYDDLVSQGKSSEAAYRLAISGIGDINEILGTAAKAAVPSTPVQHNVTQPETEEDIKRKRMRAAAIALYILSAIPLVVLDELGYEIFGLALTLIMVAAATYNILISGKKDIEDAHEEQEQASPKQEVKKSISSLVWAIGLALYFILSFTTRAWFITWVIFPIIACVRGLISAIMDLKEANDYEN